MKREEWYDTSTFLQEGLKIAERLSAMDPTNATWQNDVAVSRGLVAEVAAKIKQ